MLKEWLIVKCMLPVLLAAVYNSCCQEFSVATLGDFCKSYTIYKTLSDNANTLGMDRTVRELKKKAMQFAPNSKIC